MSLFDASAVAVLSPIRRTAGLDGSFIHRGSAAVSTMKSATANDKQCSTFINRLPAGSCHGEMCRRHTRGDGTQARHLVGDGHVDARTRRRVDAGGRVDASPRGDAPGFVAVLNERTLIIPDRTGNRRADTTINVTTNPRVGLLFMVPGIDETLRVNGSARATVTSRGTSSRSMSRW